MNNPKYLKVEFVHPWMGNPVGSKMGLLENVAINLEKRGTVKIVDNKGNPEVDKKEIKSPPKNKMVSSPKKSKGRKAKTK